MCITFIEKMNVKTVVKGNKTSMDLSLLIGLENMTIYKQGRQGSTQLKNFAFMAVSVSRHTKKTRAKC